MAEQTIDRPKPRLWLRLIVVVLLILALTGVLAYQKTIEIQAQIAQGSQPPPPISVTVAEALPGEWNRRIKAIGTLVAYQGVDITSEVSGTIKTINFDSGDEVEAGSLLVEFDERTEMANLESARAQYDADNRQYQRLLKLKDQSFVTNNDIDTQAALVDVAEAQVNVARTALSKKRIFAPFSGKLGIRRVDLGEYIAPGSRIVTLLNLNELYLDFTLPEENFNDLVEDQLIEFRVRSYPQQTFTARVETWDPELDADTRNISIRAIVNNSKRLLAPGMYADMEVRSRRKVAVLTVPETSIFYNIYGQAVYILEKPEAGENDPDPAYRLAARQVDVVYRNAGMAGISKGIKAGDLVVTAGQLKLYPNLRVAIVDDVPEFQSKAQ